MHTPLVQSAKWCESKSVLAQRALSGTWEWGYIFIYLFSSAESWGFFWRLGFYWFEEVGLRRWGWCESG